MVLETAKDTLTLNQVISQKKDTFIVEDDCIVPDVKPDILSVISSSGTTCIYKKEILDGKIRLDGCVNTYVMYLADSEENQVRSLNTNLEFTQIIDVPMAKVGMQLDANIILKGLDCKVLNGRKIHIKAILEVESKVSSNETVEYVKEISNLKDIQFLNSDFEINSLIGSGTTKVYAKDTIMLDEADNLVEVMKTDLKIINKDIKISYNKVLIKGDLLTKIIYLTDDNRINIKEATIPIVGFVDLPNISEEHLCDVKYEIKNIVVKPNNVEEHSIYVEAEIEVYCQAYENKNLKMIQDLYSPTVNLQFHQRKVRMLQKKATKEQTYSVRENQVIPEISSHKIYDVEVLPIIQTQQVGANSINYEGDLELNFIYSSNGNAGIDAKKITLPIKFTMDFDGITPDDNINTVIEISQQDFIIKQDESIDIKIDLSFTAISEQDRNISIIDEIETQEEKAKNAYSMIIYFAKPGDTLWKIAKKFNSTVENIARVNGIEDANNLQVGKQLFIPRYHGW